MGRVTHYKFGVCHIRYGIWHADFFRMEGSDLYICVYICLLNDFNVLYKCNQTGKTMTNEMNIETIESIKTAYLLNSRNHESETFRMMAGSAHHNLVMNFNPSRPGDYTTYATKRAVASWKHFRTMMRK